jgi:3-hydroxyacyl-CoA dehydrogenase
MTAINPVTDLSHEGEVAVLTLDSPPVNALSLAVREGLFEGFKAALASPARAMVLICAGRTFIAGADISNLADMMKGPGLDEIQTLMEEADRPVIAAIHGTALGGGLEIALAAHFRVAVPSARLGLPEINLGLLPGAGGTQRLPRILGPEKALEMITSGRPMRGEEALAQGLVDELEPEEVLRAGAIAFARKAVAEGRPLVRIRDREDQIAPWRGKPELFEAFRRANAGKFRGQVAPDFIIEAVQAAVEKPFDQGLVLEKQRFFEAAMSPQSQARRYYFFAERTAQKPPDAPEGMKPLEVRKAGVVGAGTMGGGITMTLANVGVPVTVVETTAEALERGFAVMRDAFERSRGATPEEVDRKMGLIRGSLDIGDLSDADLVIEAVFEDMGVKKEVFAKLDKATPPHAILASNTSFLNLDEIAGATRRPEKVVGLHFFSPAPVMPLLEVVRGEKTSAETLVTALDFGKKIRKTTVVSRVGPGFIANRVAVARLMEVDAFLLQGLSPERVDKVIYEFGFPMGTFALLDLVGLDVVPDPTKASIRGWMVAAGRRGQKSGGGFYDYDAERNPRPSPAAREVIEAFRAAKGAAPAEVSDEEILERSLYLEVNEGAKVLEQGIAARASDIDVALINGYGWPVDRGGPMYHADQVGLPKIVQRLKDFEAKYGARYRPAPLLERLAADGNKLTG